MPSCLPAFVPSRLPAFLPSRLPAFPPCPLTPAVPPDRQSGAAHRPAASACRRGSRRSCPDWKTLHELQTDHLEQRQKRDDEPAAIVDVGEQIVETAGLGFRQPGEQLIDPQLDRYLLRRQQDLGPLLRALHDGLKGGEQAEEIDLELRLVVVAGDFRDPAVGPQPLRGAQLLPFVQQARRRLEFLVLEEPPDQRVARIVLLRFDACRRLRPRQQHLRLDVNQRRRHHDVLARDVQIELLEQRDRVEILRGDQRDRNVVDADLVLPDQVQQQIERALEIGQLDRKGVGGRLELGMRLAHLYEIFTASRTRSMVPAAMVRARFDPSNSISRSRSGFASTAARRSRIGAR